MALLGKGVWISRPEDGYPASSNKIQYEIVACIVRKIFARKIYTSIDNIFLSFSGDQQIKNVVALPTDLQATFDPIQFSALKEFCTL